MRLVPTSSGFAFSALIVLLVMLGAFAVAPAQEEDVITQLERLGALKAQGILTEEEFAAQKAKLLGS